MTNLPAPTTGRVCVGPLVLAVAMAATLAWADPPTPTNQTAQYTGAPAAAAATFRTTVQEYLSCDILDSSIELSYNTGMDWWEGSSRVRVEANRAYELRTGWREWNLTGYYGRAFSDLDGFHGDGATDKLPADQRLVSGRVNILVYSSSISPPVNTYPGQPQDHLNVTFNGGQSVGVVQVTLFAW